LGAVALMLAWCLSGIVCAHRDAVYSGWIAGFSVRSRATPYLSLSDARLSTRDEQALPQPPPEPADYHETVIQREIGGGCIGFAIPDAAQTQVGEPTTWRLRRRPVGWQWRFERERIIGPGTFYVVPLWPAVLVLMASAAMCWYPAIRGDVRRGRGLCAACGYNRGGLTPAAACPECGSRPAVVRCAGGWAVRMARRPLGRFTHWSAMAAVGTSLAVWVVSLCSFVGWAGGEPQWFFAFGRGCLRIGFATPRPAAFPKAGYLEEGWLVHGPMRPNWWFSRWDNPTYPEWCVPLWSLVLASSIPAAGFWGVRLASSARRRRGQCEWCDYDRAGLTPTSPCPECGRTETL
jgi:hypothetical protein